MTMENKAIKPQAKNEADASINIRDAFKKSGPKMMKEASLKEMARNGAAKQAKSEDGGGVLGLVKSGVGGICGFVGAALGFAIGGMYAGTVVLPLIGSAFACEDHGRRYFDEMVRHFVSPFTLAVKGARRGYNAGVQAFN